MKTIEILNHSEKQSVLFEYVQEQQINCELIHINNTKLVAILVEKDTHEAHYLYFFNETVIDENQINNCPDPVYDYITGFMLKHHYITENHEQTERIHDFS
jgi:hypothetical protein